MARPLGPPTSRKEARLETRQVEQLEAIRETAPFGKPPFVSLVRKAVDEFIERALADPEVRVRVEKYLKQRSKVVALREVKK